jgi:hypothetical protein
MSTLCMFTTGSLNHRLSDCIEHPVVSSQMQLFTPVISGLLMMKTAAFASSPNCAKARLAGKKLAAICRRFPLL